jgi:Protein of unknown function (DUF1236)
MRYGLLTTAAVAALGLSVAVGIAQTTGSGNSSGGGSGMSSGSSGGAASPGGSSGSMGAGSSGGASGGTSGTSAGSGSQQRPAAAAPSTGSGTSGQASGTAGGASGTTSGQASGTARGAAGTATGSVGTGSINLTNEQRTTVTRAFSSVNVTPLTDVNFEVRSGVVLPATVNLHPCPNEVIHVLSGVRECRFVVVRNQIVIVEPSSRRIVTVIQRSS